MFGEHHDLVHEFPEHKARIHELKMNQQHFAKLFLISHKNQLAFKGSDII